MPDEGVKDLIDAQLIIHRLIEIKKNVENENSTNYTSISILIEHSSTKKNLL